MSCLGWTNPLQARGQVGPRLGWVWPRLMGICLPGYTQQDVSDWPKYRRVGLQNGEWIEAQPGTERLEAEGPGE